MSLMREKWTVLLLPFFALPPLKFPKDNNVSSGRNLNDDESAAMLDNLILCACEQTTRDARILALPRSGLTLVLRGNQRGAWFGEKKEKKLWCDIGIHFCFHLLRGGG